MLSELPVPKPLTGVVDAFWSFEGEGQQHRILPDGCLDFIFELNAGGAMVVGAMSVAQVIPIPVGSRAFGVRFRPGQAARFLDAAPGELLDSEATLADLSRLRGLAASIAEAPDHSTRIALATRALLGGSARTRAADTRVERALDAIRDAPSSLSVAALAASVDLSERRFERRFEESVGIGPKRFMRITRLQHALRIAHNTRYSQAQVAAQAGYSDEAHLLRECRALAGLTLKALGRERDVGFVQGPELVLG